MKALLEVDPQNLKSLREALCVAQGAILRSSESNSRHGYASRVGSLIDEIDKHRPLGSNGKHGKLHTATCGCEDNDKSKETID